MASHHSIVTLQEVAVQTLETYCQLTGRSVDEVLSEAIRMWVETDGAAYFEYVATKYSDEQPAESTN